MHIPPVDPLQKGEVNRKAFEKFKKEHTSVAPSIDNAAPSERFDGRPSLYNTLGG